MLVPSMKFVGYIEFEIWTFVWRRRKFKSHLRNLDNKYEVCVANTTFLVVSVEVLKALLPASTFCILSSVPFTYFLPRAPQDA